MELFTSVDGRAARVRVPGGLVDAADVPRLVEAAHSAGGMAHLTSRSTLQFRNVPDHFHLDMGADVDVIASPLDPACAGIARTVAARLPKDAPLVAVDDGSGQLLQHRPSRGLMLAGEGKARLLGTDDVVGVDEAVDKLVALEGHAEKSAATAAPLGWLERGDGLVDLGGITAFGQIPATMLEIIAVLEADLSVTPWRSLIIHGLSEHAAEAAVRVLAPMGMSFDEHSRWTRITACIGAPSCPHALSDVRADAARITDPGRVHVVGCATACGSPDTAHTQYLATGDGEYDVNER